MLQVGAQVWDKGRVCILSANMWSMRSFLMMLPKRKHVDEKAAMLGPG